MARFFSFTTKNEVFTNLVALAVFDGEAQLFKHELTSDQIKESIGSGELIFNFARNRKAELDALRLRFGIEVQASDNLLEPRLGIGDSIIYLRHDLPRLIDRDEYTDEEIAAAKFAFVEFGSKRI